MPDVKAKIKETVQREQDEQDLRLRLFEAAASKNKEEEVELLLKNKINPNLKNKFDETPLHVAAKNGSSKVVQLLLENNAEANLQDKFGNTSLHTLASRDNIKALKDLLQAVRGYPEALSDNQGRINLERIRYDQEAFENYRKAITRDSESLWDYRKAIKILLENKANLNLKDKQGRTPLHRAVAKGRQKVVQLLLENNADPDLKNDRGRSSRELFEYYFNSETQQIFLIEANSSSTETAPAEQEYKGDKIGQEQAARPPAASSSHEPAPALSGDRDDISSNDVPDNKAAKRKADDDLPNTNIEKASGENKLKKSKQK